MTTENICILGSNCGFHLICHLCCDIYKFLDCRLNSLNLSIYICNCLILYDSLMLFNYDNPAYSNSF